MKKSEKNALTDVIAMLNAIVNGSDEDGNPAHREENPSEEQIAFVRKMANEKPFNIIGHGIRPEEGIVCNIQIGKTCLRRMVTAYLEKYCHE